MIKNILHIILFSLCLICSAQPQNNLEGLYKGNKKYIYNELEFLGNGYVKINQTRMGEYFHENDYLYVITGTDVAIFIIQKNKLRGVSEWIKKNELKLINETSKSNSSIFNDNNRAELLKKYYINNNQITINSLNHNTTILDHLNHINQINSQLCEDGLDLGCIQNFSYLTMLVQNQKGEDQEKTFQHMLDLANRIIFLKNTDGYGLLFTYYLLKGDEFEAEKYLDKGIELGSELCMILSMEKYKE